MSVDVLVVIFLSLLLSLALLCHPVLYYPSFPFVSPHFSVHHRVKPVSLHNLTDPLFNHDPSLWLIAIALFPLRPSHFAASYAHVAFTLSFLPVTSTRNTSRIRIIRVGGTRSSIVIVHHPWNLTPRIIRIQIHNQTLISQKP